jgi:hypothetical protein
MASHSQQSHEKTIKQEAGNKHHKKIKGNEDAFNQDVEETRPNRG